MQSSTKAPSKYRPVSPLDIKAAARGRWNDLLQDAGLPADCLSERGRPCPKCGGEDRYNAAKDVNETGGVFCRHCFGDKSAWITPGDGIATVAWLMDTSNGEAIRWLAERLGLVRDDDGKTKPPEGVDIVTAVCRDKRMPIEAFRRFGVKDATRGRDKSPVARVNVYNESGIVHSYFDLRPGGKGKFKHGTGSAGMFFPGQLPEAGQTWLLVEGVKDAAALVGLGFHAAGMPTNKLATKYSRLFSEVNVVFVPDLDTAGKDGAQRSGGQLVGIASSVRIARLPGEITNSSGEDVRDVLKRPDGEQSVREAIYKAHPWEPSASNSDGQHAPPEVLVTLDEAEVTENTLLNLADLGWESPWIPSDHLDQVRVYQRSGNLVHVTCDPMKTPLGITLPPALPRIVTIPRPIVRERIGQAVTLYVETDEDKKRIRPPAWLASAIHQRGQYPAQMRSLAGIISCPTLRADGTVIQESGYDQATGLIYSPSMKFPPIPDKPTRDDAKRCAQELLEVVCEFPFASEDHKSTWLALVLTIIGRPAIAGPCPLFAYDANTRGSGKSLLCDAANLIATGKTSPRKSWPRDDEEVRKVITAVALEGIRTVLFDNVASTLGGSSLDAALTAIVWSDRILGKSETTGALPMTVVWQATGNNLVIGADTARRTLYCRLESLEEHPEDRQGFKHPKLLDWVSDERGRLAVAAVTLLRAYFVTDKPNVDIDSWGSFEEWSDTVGAAIVWAGAGDPLATRRDVREADRTSELLALLHEGIREVDNGNGVTAGEIERWLSDSYQENDPYPILRTVFTEICGNRPSSRRIGYALRKYRGRVRSGKRLQNRDGHGGVKRWFVEQIDPTLGGDGGNGGDNFPQQNKTSRSIPGGHGGDDVSLQENQSKITTDDASSDKNSQGRETSPPSPPSPPPITFSSDRIQGVI